MKLFRELSSYEVDQMEAWARENYKPLSPINGMWHPVVQLECVRMNAEHGGYSFLEAQS